MRREEGFSLIELLVVVAIIAVLAAIAITHIMRARLAAQEGAAIAGLRTITSAQATYAVGCGAGGYASDLADLALAPAGTSYAFIGPDLNINGISKSGYLFRVERNAAPGTMDVLLPSCNGAANPRVTSFFASATPIVYGQTGTRYFATDTPGTVYQDPAFAIPNPIPPGTLLIQ